jgi:hypothetical protein
MIITAEQRQAELKQMTDNQLLEIQNDFNTVNGLCPNRAETSISSRENAIDFILDMENCDSQLHWERNAVKKGEKMKHWTEDRTNEQLQQDYKDWQGAKRDIDEDPVLTFDEWLKMEKEIDL